MKNGMLWMVVLIIPPLGCASGGGVMDGRVGGGLVSGETDPVSLVSGYSSLRKMTDNPVYVPRSFALRCRLPTSDEVERESKASGPHAFTAIQIYMNDLAASHFKHPAGPYPVGSVIVKEKLSVGRASGASLRKDTPYDGIGGMIKRPSGYNPETGDWEFFYFEPPNSLQSGPLPSCAQCHIHAQSSDYVFGVFGHSVR